MQTGGLIESETISGRVETDWEWLENVCKDGVSCVYQEPQILWTKSVIGGVVRLLVFLV